MGYVYFNTIAIVFLTVSLATFVSFLISPLIAWKKGYAPYYWLFASGPVGLVVICCLRSLHSAQTPEEYERLEARANWIGGVLTGVALFLSMGLVPLFLLR